MGRMFDEEEKAIISFIQELGVTAYAGRGPETILPGTQKPLWQACLEAKLYSWGRDSDIEMLISSVGGSLFDEHRESHGNDAIMRAKRFVVLEAAMAVGLGSWVGEYIIRKQPTIASSSSSSSSSSRNDMTSRMQEPDFLLQDVGTIFQWAADMYKTTANEAFAVSRQVLVPYLIHKCR